MIPPDHAMRALNGDLYYPDDEHEARWFAEVHEALPVRPDRFPFDIAEPTVRARVTLTVQVLASGRIEATDGQLQSWVADRLGHVVDSGPFSMRVSPYGQLPEVWVPVSFGAIDDGPVEWLDGSAPEAGWHYPSCREPKRPDAGPCQRLEPHQARSFPCSSEDADHHGTCSYRPPQRGRGVSAGDVS